MTPRDHAEAAMATLDNITPADPEGYLIILELIDRLFVRLEREFR